MKLHKCKWTLEQLSARVVHILGILLFLILTAISLFFTRYFVQDYSVEKPYTRLAVFPLTLLFAGILCFFVLFIGRRIADGSGREQRRVRILLGAVLLWSLFFGSVWVLLAKSTPVADQYMVTSSAQRFLEGNYGRFEYGKYLYYYPFQLGLAAYEELVFRLFGADNYTALQLINVLGVTASIAAGYGLVSGLYEKRRTACYYLLLCAGCFPFFIYAAYLYGDVLSITLSMTALWQLVRYIRKGKKSGVLVMMLSLAAAVLLRGNSLIILIAIACVLAVEAVSRKKWSYLLCILLLCAGAAGGRQALNRYYEAKSGTALNEGMPSVLWIAMGMQEGDMEAGWYNGYSIYLYQDVCHYDEPTAQALGFAEVKARAKVFLKDPLYGVNFYFRKFASQWNEPTYGCFIMTYAADQGRSSLGESLYTGRPNQAFQIFMDSYQLVIYGAVLFLLLRKRKAEEPLEWYVLLIAVIGGVLFHELWEAKSRYVLPYFIAMLPMAAEGLFELSSLLENTWQARLAARKARTNQ